MPETVGIAAFRVQPDSVVDEARRALTRAFGDTGIATPRLDARVLLMAACGLSHASLIRAANERVTPAQAERLEALAARRLAGEPVSRILGTREFWGLEFALSPETLDPRPDTETLVQAVLDAVRPRAREPMRLLDLGTGTGCILVALLHELPFAFGIGTDISHAALATARDNARRNGVSARAGFVQSDWLAGVDGRFDVVVANPPYVAGAEIASLSSEVRCHDPIAALDGGMDGLTAYRAIVPDLTSVLAPGGVAAFEVGAGQAHAVAQMVLASDAEAVVQPVPDLAGIMRVVVVHPACVDGKAKKELERAAIRDSLA